MRQYDFNQSGKQPKKVGQRNFSAPRKIGLMGCWGFGNMGNLAHQIAMIQNIRKYQPNAQLYGFSVYPEITQKIHGIPCFTFYRHPNNQWWQGKSFLTRGLNKFSTSIRRISNPVLRKLLIPIRVPVEIILEILAVVRSFKVLKGFDMLIITGGGHFDDVYGGARVLPYALCMWASIAKLRKVDFLVVSNGVGPINERLSKFFFKQVLSSASYLSYRDDYSKEYAERILNLHVTHDLVYPDLAHSLDLTAYQNSFQPKNEQRTIVGIAPIPFDDESTFPGFSGEYTSAYLSYLSKLASFISWLLENQYVVFFFFADKGDRQAIQDLKRVLDKSKISYSEEQITEQPPPTNSETTFDEYMTQLAKTDLVIASRFHGVLLAQLLNKPTLALSFAKKTDCLMADTNQADYCLSINHFDVETIKEKFIALEENQALIKRQLANRTQQYREALAQQYVYLFGHR
ncbi:MAG: polysaccharide pyruvyl transferase family protein [Elainella sp. C42_A2020_010]|nr:polysaccharide pyruvyl transferase family protein [Elainella sp. C42_A2020_010]